MSEAYQYRGDLARTALPEILSTIEKFGVSGVIDVHRDDVQKRVYLKDGNVIHATSTDRADSLGQYLLRSGKLSEEAFRTVTQERDESDTRYGVLLLALEKMTPAAVYEGVQDQIEAIVWSLFSLADGEVNFTIGEGVPSDMIQIQLPLRRVIFQGILQIEDPKTLVARLGQRDTVFEPTYQGEELIEIGLSHDDYAMLKRVDGHKTLYELCADGPLVPAQNARLIYAFSTLHLVRRASDPAGVKVQIRTAGDEFGD